MPMETLPVVHKLANLSLQNALLLAMIQLMQHVSLTCKSKRMKNNLHFWDDTCVEPNGLEGSFSGKSQLSTAIRPIWYQKSIHPIVD